VDFALTADQEDLRDGIRRLCAGRFPMARVRAAEATGGIDVDGWRELEEAGVFALRQPDGLGLGVVEAAVVYEELGRALVPGPLVGTLVAAAWCGAPVAVAAELAGLNGGLVVTHPGSAGGVLVVEPDRVSLLDADALGPMRPLAPIDPLTPVALVPGFVTGPVARLGQRVVAEGAEASRLRAEAIVLTAALLTGIAGAVQDLAVAYVAQREQFGRPVGSFQAVKHLAADMLVRTELARSATYAAAAHLDEDLPGPARPVAAAKAMAGEAAIRNGEAAIQAHGGMGFTWEVDAHLYLKRAWVHDQAFGSAHQQALALAELL
jgi:alkylation response protein AidB-like acyl-CoA dehydrogenase